MICKNCKEEIKVCPLIELNPTKFLPRHSLTIYVHGTNFHHFCYSSNLTKYAEPLDEETEDAKNEARERLSGDLE